MPKANWNAWEDDDGVDSEKFKTLTPEEAQALRRRFPAVSPWRVVAAQAAVGLVCWVLWRVLAADVGKASAAMYGAVAVVLPNALMAWGLTRRPAPTAAAAFLSLMLWESIKILLTMAILLAVVTRVKDLSWLALLTTLFLTLKVNWLALLLQGRSKSISDGN
ncbi:MAG TPA: ATP synthase subunit I [Burkholderiaceae bacterium]|jgi:ATP synthase protein I